MIERERADDMSPFKRRDSDREPYRRIRQAFGFMAFEHDHGRAMHCLNLCRIWELSHYKIEHGNDVDAERDVLIKIASATEEMYPDIAAVLTAEQAAANYGW
jgi:hypothetical protein